MGAATAPASAPDWLPRDVESENWELEVYPWCRWVVVTLANVRLSCYRFPIFGLQTARQPLASLQRRAANQEVEKRCLGFGTPPRPGRKGLSPRCLLVRYLGLQGEGRTGGPAGRQNEGAVCVPLIKKPPPPDRPIIFSGLSARKSSQAFVAPGQDENPWSPQLRAPLLQCSPSTTEGSDSPSNESKIW